MSGDYLWDRTGPRELDVVELETLLGSLTPAAMPPCVAVASGARRGTPVTLMLTFASAAAVAALVVLVWASRSTLDVPVGVTSITGAAAIDGRLVSDRRVLRVGSQVDVDAHASVRIDVGGVAQVDAGPDTRLRLLRSRSGEYRLRLDRGTLRALVSAPPGQLSIDTPSSTVVDLGCAFTLSVDEAGVGRVHVVSGWVGLEGQGREAFVPAGATCVARPGSGPGVARFDDAPQNVQQALDAIDGGGGAADVDRAIDRVLADARPRDTLSLWHLIARVDSRQRDRVFDRLAQFVPTPPGVTREGICAGDREMLEQWRAGLGADTDRWWAAWHGRHAGVSRAPRSGE